MLDWSHLEEASNQHDPTNLDLAPAMGMWERPTLQQLGALYGGRVRTRRDQLATGSKQGKGARTEWGGGLMWVACAPFGVGLKIANIYYGKPFFAI